LRSCRDGCHAEKVRLFLGDFIGYINAQFDNGSQSEAQTDVETDIYVKHALRDEDSLALFLGAVKVFNAVAGRIISGFTRAVSEKVADELNRLGSGWRVVTDESEAQANELWENVGVSRAGWPGGPSWRATLRVVLAHDKAMPTSVYFQARREMGAPADAVADRLAAALDGRCGRGKRDAPWWPCWYRHEEGLADWADAEVLLALWRKGDAVDHFAGQLVRMALAVDEALKESLSS
jgi:hypothetical protein